MGAADFSGRRFEPVDRTHSSAVNAVTDAIAVDDRAGLNQRFDHRSPSDRQAIGQPERQAIFANPRRRRLDEVVPLEPAAMPGRAAGMVTRKRVPRREQPSIRAAS